MLPLTSKGARALEAVLLIAYQKGEPLSSRQLAAMLGCTERFLEPMMQKLVRDGVLASQRGPSGGYVLARAAARISVFDVLYALETEHNLPRLVSDIGQATLAPLLADVRVSRRQELQTITLDALCRKYDQHPSQTKQRA